MSEARTGREQCRPNISPAEQRKRMAAGAVALLAALAGLAVILSMGLDREWRLALCLPLWGAALGFLQAREKT